MNKHEQNENSMELNNIIKVSRIDTILVSDFFRIQRMKAMIGNEEAFQPIKCMKTPASLSVTDKIEDGQHIYTAKLVMQVSGGMLPNVDRQTWIAETVDGVRYLIGTDSRPYPVTLQQETHPGNYSDSQLTEVTVTYSSPWMLPILV